MRPRDCSKRDAQSSTRATEHVWVGDLMRRPIQSLVLFLALLLPASAFAVNADEPFAVQACNKPISAEAGADLSIPFSYLVFKDHFIYRDMSSVTVKVAPSK